MTWIVKSASGRYYQSLIKTIPRDIYNVSYSQKDAFCFENKEDAFEIQTAINNHQTLWAEESKEDYFSIVKFKQKAVDLFKGETMKLKIISDGTSKGTKLIDSDTGSTLPMVHKIEWSVNADEPLAKCTVQFINVPVAFEADLGEDTLMSPCSIQISPDVASSDLLGPIPARQECTVLGPDNPISPEPYLPLFKWRDGLTDAYDYELEDLLYNFIRAERPDFCLADKPDLLLLWQDLRTKSDEALRRCIARYVYPV